MDVDTTYLLSGYILHKSLLNWLCLFCSVQTDSSNPEGKINALQLAIRGGNISTVREVLQLGALKEARGFHNRDAVEFALMDFSTK